MGKVDVDDSVDHLAVFRQPNGEFGSGKGRNAGDRSSDGDREPAAGLTGRRRIGDVLIAT